MGETGAYLTKIDSLAHAFRLTAVLFRWTGNPLSRAHRNTHARGLSLITSKCYEKNQVSIKYPVMTQIA